MTEMVVGVVDHGSGNLHSVHQALVEVGARVVVSRDADELARADALVLPGVGALGTCMAALVAMGGDDLVMDHVDAGRPLLGICVGHQMLFESGAERGESVRCLGLLEGRVRQMPTPRLPHMGWNTVTAYPGGTLFNGVGGERFYFVHSCAVVDPPTTVGVTTCDHEGCRFVAAMESGPVSSVQFHPEKSGPAGLRLLHNWVSSLQD